MNLYYFHGYVNLIIKVMSKNVIKIKKTNLVFIVVESIQNRFKCKRQNSNLYIRNEKKYVGLYTEVSE